MLITPNSQDYWDSQVVLVVKNPPANAGDLSSIPGLERSPGAGNSNLTPENPMDGTVSGVAKSRARLSDCHFLIINSFKF